MNGQKHLLQWLEKKTFHFLIAVKIEIVQKMRQKKGCDVELQFYTVGDTIVYQGASNGVLLCEEFTLKNPGKAILLRS